MRRSLRRVPGGLTATRVAVSRRGGLTAILLAVCVWVTGVAVGGLVGGSAGGVLRFALTLVAAPTMPAFGLPATDGSARVMLAVATSAALWFAVGQWAAAASSRRVLSGWREWAAEVAPLAAGVAVGALSALVLAALLLGVI